MTTTQAGPSWAQLRAKINEHAASQGEWGGAPMPIQRLRLVMEPRYPFPNMNGFRLPCDEDKPDAAVDYTLVNQWYCWRRNVMVYVCREADGRYRAVTLPNVAEFRFRFWFNTLAVAADEAWTIDVETRAMEKLGSLVTEQAFKCYLLAGAFIETSKRSGVTYIFRKLRPTLALRPNKAGTMNVIAVLCMHPLGYYEQSWAGVMCPTDDVIAHLMLMRGDEPRLWRKANHHQLWMPEAGV